MSINVKKLATLYYQEDSKKVLYVYLFDGRVRVLDKKKFETYHTPAARAWSINDSEIEPNKVLFFNKEIAYSFYYIFFNNNLFEVSLSRNEGIYSLDEITILIKEKIYKQNQKFEQIKKQVEMYEKFESKQNVEKREPIPEDVRFEVWRRDGGKCVKCGSQKNLEFDHIIPFSKGGSSTARNIQLLCQDCNRHKSDKI